MDLIKPGRVIDFMGMRRGWIIFSVLLVVASAVLLYKPGPKYGIDFTGGTEVTVRFGRPVDAARLRAVLTRMGHGNAEVVPSTNIPNTFIIRVERTSSISGARQQQIRAAAAAALGPPMTLTEFRVSEGGDHIILQLSGAKTDVEVATLVREAGA